MIIELVKKLVWDLNEDTQTVAAEMVMTGMRSTNG